MPQEVPSVIAEDKPIDGRAAPTESITDTSGAAASPTPPDGATSPSGGCALNRIARAIEGRTVVARSSSTTRKVRKIFPKPGHSKTVTC